MKKLTNTRIQRATQMMVAGLIAFFMVACSKQVDQPAQISQPVKATEIRTVNGLQLNQSELTLLQNNEDNPAISATWMPGSNAGTNVKYTLEIAVDGTNFDDPFVLGTTDMTNITFTTGALNKTLCQLVHPGTKARFDIRIKAEYPNTNNAPQYSNAVAVDVTTFQYFIEYKYPQFIKVPGNYQGWNLTNAPKLVSTQNDGEYEGYINFTNAYPQLLLVKGTEYTKTNTYSFIGKDKIGFGGTILSVFGGAGIYRVTVNLNNNTWAYTKVNTLGLHGTAVTAGGENDLVMNFDPASLTYQINTNLQKGDFRFRVNNQDAGSIGENIAAGYEIPVENGANFTVDKPGNYTLTLDLKAAGNYVASVIRQVNNNAVNGK
jgi:starch-binding outer membrane protein SusE/F